jgi:biotin carboxyl carrier protein
MKYSFVHNKKEYTLILEKAGKDYTAYIGDIECNVTDVEQNQIFIVFTLNGTRYAVYASRNGPYCYLNIAGEDYVIEQHTRSGSRKNANSDQAEDSVSSPMPGLVVKIPVSLGDEVNEGATLAVIEAMKMQNELRASRKGRVKRINFREGEQVDAFQPIVELE